jgi:hypothetical protein
MGPRWSWIATVAVGALTFCVGLWLFTRAWRQGDTPTFSGSLAIVGLIVVSIGTVGEVVSSWRWSPPPDE